MQGIKPVWEDPQNVGGGKWIVRLRKGLADRLWEQLICALIGDHFDAISSDICGCVISVRQNEDIISVWNQDSTDGPANLKIRSSLFEIRFFLLLLLSTSHSRLTSFFIYGFKQGHDQAYT